MSDGEKDLERLLGSPRRALFHMAAPLFLALLVGYLQNVIDSIWCSGLGADELSAVSISHPVYSLLIAFGGGIGVGATAAIAKLLGESRKEDAEKAAGCTIFLTAIIAVCSSCVMWFLAEPLASVSGGGNNLGLCMEYLKPFLWMSFFLMMNGVLTGLLRAEGSSRRSMYLSMTASIANIILDPLMIYGLGMGVKGAAVATCLSFLIITVIGLYWYLSGRNYLRLVFNKLRFPREIYRDIAIVGIPCALEMILSPLLMIPEQALVVSCGGPDGLVVYINAFHFVHLALIPAMALNKSLVPILSAALGQRDVAKMEECIRLTLRIVLGMQLVLGLFIFVAADILTEAFMNSPSMESLRGEMTLATRIFAASAIFNAVQGTGMSVMQASRHAGLATAMTFVREFIFLGTYFVACRISMEAIYWSLDITNLACMLLILWLMRHVMRLVSRDLGLRRTETI
ncbi:MAG: MATE family efflux transporter [archaeon]|nr:MATE family efflux transporter [archaeon]